MTTGVETAQALKEWAAVIAALERGRQILTLRKGGIREKAFLLEARGFYLLPTFEHQASDLLKPSERWLLADAATRHDERGLIVRTRAEVVAHWEIDAAEQLAALDPFHCFTAGYTRSRFNWRPKQPLTVLALRVCRLAVPWQTGLPLGVGGCRSWLDLDAEAAPREATPVLSDTDFERRVERIRAALAEVKKLTADG